MTMMKQTSLFATALCILTAATTSNATLHSSNKNEDVEAHSNNNLRRKTEATLGGSLCKSIIAIGGTRKYDHSAISSPTSSDRTLESNNGVIEHPYRSSNEYDYETDEEFVCELSDDSGTTIPLEGTTEQMTELRALLNQGALISAESTVEIDSIGSIAADVVDGVDGMISGGDNDEPTVAKLAPGSIKLINDGRNRDRALRRRLNRHNGVKKALVIRVIDRYNRAVSGNASYLSDKFFGTNGDSVTMKSGFNDCTFGKLQFTNEYNDQNIDKVLSAPGVMEVKIDISLSSSTQSQIRSAVLQAAQSKLGFSLPGQSFDHVLIVAEHCYPNSQDNCAFAAYAFVNSWLSVYVDDNYKFPAVSMHELGHNLNLAHSGGLDGKTYTDHTCLMGNPLWEDDVGGMCFNPVKNYQVAVANNG